MQRLECVEAMDAPELDPELLAGDLRALERLNRLFGGRSLLRRRLGRAIAALPPGREVRLLDVGAGAGDLSALAVDLCRAQGRPVRLWALDRHPQIQAYARRRLGAAYPEVDFLRGDARALPLREGAVDFAFCTLALHHLREEEAVAALAELKRVARCGALVADLVRGPVALAAVWLATRCCANPMTRHDGPASVRRSYTPAELRRLAEAAGWEGARLFCEPWFRMTLVYPGSARW